MGIVSAPLIQTCKNSVVFLGHFKLTDTKKNRQNRFVGGANIKANVIADQEWLF